MESILILIIPVLMLSGYYLKLCSNRSRLNDYSKYVVLEIDELNPFFAGNLNNNKVFNKNNLTFVLLAGLFLFWIHFRMDGSYFFKLVYGIFLIILLRANALHLCNIFIFRYVRKNPNEIKGQITQSAKYFYTLSASNDFAFTIVIAPLALLSKSFYIFGAAIGGVLMTVTHISSYRNFNKIRETNTKSSTSENKPGFLLKEQNRCILIVLIAILAAIEGYQIYLDKTYTKEEIDTAFEYITSGYGIKIVYEIGDDFFSPLKNPPIPAGPPRKSKVTPIRHRVLLRYPRILETALEKYPIHVIKNYLNGIQFAGELEDDVHPGYWGTYDPFRQIIYLMDDGIKTDDQAMGTFHHEFSSLLLKSHSFWGGTWTDHNPGDFKYYLDRYDNYAIMKKNCEADKDYYQKGMVSNYGLTSFENDFNEYSEMIFTYPEKFKKIMEKYPRVRGKFKVWLRFYQKIDPVFSEAYLFGKSGKASK